MPLLREPLLHFIVAGVAIFVLQHTLQRQANAHSIVVTHEQVQRLAQNYRTQFGAPPSSQQLVALVDETIRGEILYREALKIGLDEDDAIIRRRLIQKYQFLQEDPAVPSKPTEIELIGFYRQHAKDYVQAATVTFTHAYFSVDTRGDEGARQAAAAAASRLNRSHITREAEGGDPFPGPRDLSAVTKHAAARVFGRDGLSQQIFDVVPGKWSPPLRSGFGWHTVYVSARQPARQSSFAEVRNSVEQDYLERQREMHNAQLLARLYDQYRIVRADQAQASPQRR